MQIGVSGRTSYSSHVLPCNVILYYPKENLENLAYKLVTGCPQLTI